MALTSTSSPSSSQPIPISDCLRWAFQIDDADIITTPGTNAAVVVTFPNSPSDPGDGTEFTLWGHVLTTESAVDYSATSFKVAVGDKLQTMNNFASMIQSNFYFLEMTTVTVGASTVTITWNTCGEQENFGASQMSFSGIAGSAITSAVATNGDTAVYTDGYLFQTKLLRTDIVSDDTGYVTGFEGTEPNKLCDTTDEVSFDAMPTVRRLLKTPMPALDNTHPVTEYDGIIQYFSLLYGWTYQDANCQPKSGDFNYTARSFVWNAYFGPEDIYKARKYWPGASGGLPSGQTHVKFLTTQPSKMRFFKDSRCWLWFMTNEAVQNLTSPKLLVTVTLKDTTTDDTTVNLTLSGYGIDAVNVSPRYIDSLFGSATIDTIDHYTVYIVANNVRITEIFTYYVIEGCDSDTDTDLYFLTPPGGIGTIPVQIIGNDAVQQGDEILLDVPCTASSADKGRYGGRTLSNIRSYESFKFRAYENGAITDYFRDLKLSPQRWVRRTAEDGSWVARKLIIEPGGIKIYEDGVNVTAEVTGYLGDIIIQSGAEPIL